MRQTRMWSGLALGCALVLAAGCGGSEDRTDAPGALAMDQNTYETWEIALVEMRIQKNEEFADPNRSPLPEAQVPTFEALNYYYPLPELRFETPLIAEAGTDTVRLAKRKGGTVPYLRRGTVSFRHAGKVHTLPVFGPADTSRGDYLWLPFTDLTTGRDTYAGGRYLDLAVDSRGMVDLDFNYAYNPLCMYNPEKYNCTLPPPESRLDFAVEAGEKIYGPEAH